MACPCSTRNKQAFKVKLAGGTTITKRSEQEAVAYAARHPGAVVIKPAKAA